MGEVTITKAQWKEWLDFQVTLKKLVTDDTETPTYLQIVADIFNITTYDAEMDTVFGEAIVNVLYSIATRGTFRYIEESKENYMTYLTVVNLTYIPDLLGWGSSIRGAWFDAPKDGWDLEEHLGNYYPPEGLQPILESKETMEQFIIMLKELIDEQQAELIN